MTNAHDQVHRLLEQMREVVKSPPPKYDELSDQLYTLTMSHMTPTIPDSEPWLGIHVTKTESRILECLKAKFGQGVTKQAIFAAMYFDRVNDEPDMKIIDILVCKIRSRLPGTGYWIETIWGEGYRLIKSDPQHAQGKAA